jgi:N-acetylglucosaminylphosphatidylinositol deacetylase
LSNGNFEGLGQIREKEMVNASKYLKVKNLEFGNFEDGMNNLWDVDDVAHIIKKYQQLWKIEVIVTFDAYGVSGHNNHISAY